MITLEDYFGTFADHPDATPERKANAETLLDRVNALLNDAETDGLPGPINPATGSRVSGETLGGFRPQDAAQGAPKSNHKQGRAIDIFDPGNKLDAWLDDAKLEHFDLYREAPDATRGWCHLASVPPASGRRTFRP